MTVAEPQTKQQPDSFVQLSFSQRLVPKKGGSISISDLQQRLQVGAFMLLDLVYYLKNLHNELKRMEQETVNVNSLNIVSRELVSATLVQHKDKGVRSLVACCLADVLRLYAPEAPYNENELCVGLTAKNIALMSHCTIGNLCFICKSAQEYWRYLQSILFQQLIPAGVALHREKCCPDG